MKGDAYSIYTLRCPIEDKIRYVGYSRDLKQRYIQHVSGPNKCTKKWVCGLREQDKWPVMDEIEAGLSLAMARNREKYWIEKIQKEHGSLFNVRFAAPTVIPRVLPINLLKKDDDQN